MMLLWLGPVSKGQIVASVPKGVLFTVLTCTGDGSDGGPRCQDRADKWLDTAGRRIPTMRDKLGLKAGPLWLAAFSAGGQIVKRLGLNAQDRAEIAGMYLADATYTAKWAAPGQALVDDVLVGFVKFALEALKDDRPMLATASSFPNKKMPTGSQSLAAIRREIEAESGQTFQDASGDPFLAGLLPPVAAWRLGSILFVDWGDRYKHGEHVTVIAPVLLPRLMGSSPAGSVWRWVPAFGAALLAVAYIAKHFLWR